MNSNIIQKHLQTKWLGKKIDFRPSVDSTNSWALEALEKGAKRGEVFLADFQTRGHGRLERHWESLAGKNILLTLIDDSPEDPASIPQLTLVAGVGFLEGLKSHFPELDIKLKWPNDFIVKDRKLGGILCQRHSSLPKVVVGVGININVKPDEFSPEIEKTATSLSSALGKETSREELIASCLNNYEKWRSVYDESGLSKIIEAWKGHSSLINKKVKIVEPQESYEGIAEGLDGDGFLIVNANGQKRKVISGDVVLL